MPVVEILGPWTKNKGDVLMLAALTDRFGGRAHLVGSPQFGQVDPQLARVRQAHEYAAEIRAAMGRGRLVAASRTAVNALALNVLPIDAAARRGAVPGRSVDILFDCSGFAYGDAWTTRRPVHRARYYRELKRRGALLVLLPQAFGPFERPDMRQAITELLEPIDLVCVRDAVSLEHVRGLGVPDGKLLHAPDITHAVAGRPPQDADAWADRVAIVPNARMIDATRPDAATRYLDYLAAVAAHVRSRDLEPWLVQHEANDAAVVQALNAQLDASLPVLDEDAILTKGILGACRVVVSSRFHAIVSALSSATPVVATSWSHKYRALYDEYDAADLVADPSEPEAVMAARLDRLVEPGTRGSVSATLSAAAARHRLAVEAMWRRIEAMIAVRTTGRRHDRLHIS